MTELWQSFLMGKLTEADLVEDMLTRLGSGLYAYMTMLETQERKSEANRLERLRERIFQIRTCQSGLHLSEEQKTVNVIAEMEKIALELGVLHDMLKVYRPAEATILQHPANFSLGLVHVLKDVKERATK